MPESKWIRFLYIFLNNKLRIYLDSQEATTLQAQIPSSAEEDSSESQANESENQIENQKEADTEPEVTH